MSSLDARDAYASDLPEIVLGSGSPRRRELLRAAHVPHTVLPADLDEARLPGESPGEMMERLARAKALAVAERLGAEDPRWVLGADTGVVLGEKVLGKPETPEHAVEMLQTLTGREHDVITGVAFALLREAGVTEVHSMCVATRVRMREATLEEIREYVATGESMDKAGAYALQGAGGRFVVALKGSRTNVIGLPVDETLALLRSLLAGEAPT